MILEEKIFEVKKSIFQNCAFFIKGFSKEGRRLRLIFAKSKNFAKSLCIFKGISLKKVTPWSEVHRTNSDLALAAKCIESKMIILIFYVKKSIGPTKKLDPISAGVAQWFRPPGSTPRWKSTRGSNPTRRGFLAKCDTGQIWPLYRHWSMS